jgi:hypothetical protein
VRIEERKKERKKERKAGQVVKVEDYVHIFAAYVFPGWP